MSIKFKNWRFYFVVVIFLSIGAALWGRLFFLQVSRGQYYQALSENKGQLISSLPKRGNIYFTDRFGKIYPAALTTETFDLFVIPSKIEDAETVATLIGEIIGEDSNLIKEKFSNKKLSYSLIKSRLDKNTAQKLQKLELEGIGLEEKQSRSYPFQDLAANVLGFLSYSDILPKGQYGLEEFYNKKLLALGGNLISNLTVDDYKAETGDSLILTIDYNVQRESERILDSLTEKFDSQAGSVIVMEPETGAILAMANRPAFNPNEYFKVDDLEVFKNLAIQSNYEPGSIFKIFTMAAGLEDKIITPSTIYNDEGRVKISNIIIKNYDNKAHGYQTMSQVLEKSLNTGSVFVVGELNKRNFLNYLKKFGFGSKTKIDLVGEMKGDVSNLKRFNEINYATASFGQGISVTALQLTSAISVVANDGILMKPYLVDKIISKDGQTVKTESEIISEPISSLTASQLTGMLVGVAERGLNKKAYIPGYQVAVKTGTAQIAKPEGGGYGNETIHTIAGFAPALNPRFTVLIRLDKPQGLRFASDTLGPAFNELTRFLLNYYEIAPQL